MEKLKKFLLYVIVIIAFWIFSDILVYIAINGTYKKIDAKVNINSPEISITDCKATYVNGYIKGSIKNNTNDIINKKYVKIDLYSPRDIKLGTKYVKIENLEKNNFQNFDMWYKYTNVKYAIITTVDDVQNVPEEEFLSQEMPGYLLISTLFIIYFL